jgi:hypothetical protein
MSRASIDREKSRATTRSSPRCFSSLARPASCGRAAATSSSASASTSRAPRSTLRGTDTLAAMRSTSTRPPSRSSSRRRRVNDTTSASTTSGTSSNDHSSQGWAKRMVRATAGNG